MKVAIDASSAQMYRSGPYPSGCASSAGLALRFSAASSITSVTVSATECAASASIALDPLMTPPTALAAAMPRFVTTATRTVPTLSSSLPPLLDMV